MFSKILVGFDGSGPSERALRTACAIALKFEATIEVCHTPKDETVIFAAEAISGFYIGPNIAKAEALAETAQKMGDLRAGLPVTVALRRWRCMWAIPTRRMIS